MKYLQQNLFNGKIEVSEAPIPKIEKNEVLIKSINTLISSGTERSLIEFGKSNILKKVKDNKERVGIVIDKIKNDGLINTLDLVEKKINKPIQIGYSNLGIVSESKSSKFQKGDKVISNGFHSEYVKVGHNLCVKVPNEINDHDAIFSVLGAIALNGIRKLKTEINETIVVYGFGLIGNIASRILKASGVNIIVTDIDDSKKEEAEKLGFIFCNPTRINLENFINDKTDNNGCDSVLICTNSKDSEPIIQSSKIVRKLGKIILIGEAQIEIPRKIFYDKEIAFEVSKSYGPGRYDYNYENKGLDYPFEYVRWTENRNIETIINLIQKKSVSFKDLVYNTYEIDDYKNAYKTITSNETSKAVLFKYSFESIESKNNLINSEIKSFSDKEFSAIGAGNQSLSILFPIFKKKGNLSFISGNSPINISNSIKKFGFKNFIENENELYSNKNIKNLIISTPHFLHAESIIKSIKNNKNIFLEKPMAINLKELNKIQNEINGLNEIPVMRLNFNRRYSSYSNVIKEKLLNPNSSKTIQININTKDYSQSNNWLADKTKSGGIIIGEACHFIDLAKFFTGSKVVEYKIFKSRNKDFQIILNFNDDSSASINYFFNGTSKYPKENIKIFTEADVIEIDNFKKFKSFSRNVRSNFFSKQDKGHEKSIEDFIEKVTGAKKQDIEEIKDYIDTTRISIELSNNVE